MHETGVEEQIGDQLIEVEIACHKEMQAADVGQIDAAHLQDECGNECDQIDDQQIFCDGWYAEHHAL